MLIALTACCLMQAANIYKIEEPRLWALLAQERGRVGEVSTNKNQTQDLGPFQINSSWMPAFAKYWHLGSTLEAYTVIRDNGCANVYAAAAILHTCELETGSKSQATGCYHSHNQSLATPYRLKVEQRMSQFVDALNAKKTTTFCRQPGS